MQRKFYDCCLAVDKKCLAVDKNEDLIAFAGKTEVPSALVPFLESYLETMTTKNDNILTSSQNYINSAEDKVSDFQEPRASIRSRVSSPMASSKTSSERKHDYVIAKIKREEIEKQHEAAIRLAKHIKQMELDELEGKKETVGRGNSARV